MSNTGVWEGQSKRIYIQEVGTRDGLQSESVFVDTDKKIALVNALSATGLAKIEVTAFVSPKAIPALSDADVVMRSIERNPAIVYTALVPNIKGAERAIASGTDELNLVMSASETHNLCNLRMTREQSFSGLVEVTQLAKAAGRRVNISLSCVFGCPMEGDVPVPTVFDWCDRFITQLGADGVTLCDTTGMANPRQVAEITRAFIERWPNTELTLHFHNTRGMGLANILAAIDAGANRFDTSIGGIGGCPYAPGATGNVCSEEVVHALGLMHYQTGVDLVKLIAAAKMLAPLIGHDVPSQIVKAGRSSDLHQRPANFDEIRERALRKNAA